MSKKLLEKAIIRIINSLITDYDEAIKSELANIATVELTNKGNFINPESGKEYGYKFVIGEPDFWEEDQENINK